MERNEDNSETQPIPQPRKQSRRPKLLSTDARAEDISENSVQRHNLQHIRSLNRGNEEFMLFRATDFNCVKHYFFVVAIHFLKLCTCARVHFLCMGYGMELKVHPPHAHEAVIAKDYRPRPMCKLERCQTKRRDPTGLTRTLDDVYDFVLPLYFRLTCGYCM